MGLKNRKVVFDFEARTKRLEAAIKRVDRNLARLNRRSLYFSRLALTGFGAYAGARGLRLPTEPNTPNLSLIHI